MNKTQRSLCIVFTGLSILSLYYVTNKQASNNATSEKITSINTLDRIESKRILSNLPSTKNNVITANNTLHSQLSNILLKNQSEIEPYKKIIELLKSNEILLLKTLGERNYPHSINPDDPKSEEIAIITRAMIEFYRDKPLYETLEKIEFMYNSGLLYSSVVTDLLFVTEGWENTNTAYDWVMINPAEHAAKQSGRTIGGKLADFDPDYAWEKSQLLPEGHIRSGALSSVISVIASNDVKKAINLVTSIPITPDLDRAISDLVEVAIESGLPFESIVRLAASPIDTNFRMGTLTQLFQHWALKDSSSLTSWVSKNHHFPLETNAELQLMSKQALKMYSVDI